MLGRNAKCRSQETVETCIWCSGGEVWAGDIHSGVIHELGAFTSRCLGGHSLEEDGAGDACPSVVLSVGLKMS